MTRSNIQWQRGIERIALTSTGAGKRIVGLTSASPAAGVSLVCHHLARTIAALAEGMGRFSRLGPVGPLQP